jgi:integrative and conjugative element protein (TIGR02256 family)
MQVILSLCAYYEILTELRPWKKVETGGVLVGQVQRNKFVISKASGPGPRAKRLVSTVVVDGDFSTRFCKHIEDQTSGMEVYLGDWHSHTGYSVDPSALDLSAMHIMSPFAPFGSPLSLIISARSRRFRVFILKRGRLEATEFALLACGKHRNSQLSV